MQIDLPIELFTYPEIALPDIWTVEQLYDTPTLTEAQITVQVRESVANLLQGAGLKPGAAVAVGTGSRGLDNLVLVIRTVVTAFHRAASSLLYIIPARRFFARRSGLARTGFPILPGHRGTNAAFGATPSR